MVVEVGSINWYKYLSKFGIEEVSKKVRRKNRQRILNVYSAFDIETSTIWLNPNKQLYDVHSFMYHWQFCIEEYTVVGRTWEQFFDFLKILREAIEKIREDNNLTQNPLLIVFVHNLSYEWTFLASLYPFRNDELFLREERKPIYCRMFDTFELRCSYLQTNLSLEALCKQTGVKHKLSGQEFDYDKIRYPWTPLTDKELEYCVTDVESLVQAMKFRIQRGGDNLQTAPITSTGYVRRECKDSIKDLFLDMREMKPGKKEFQLLRKSFRGGNTHANKLLVDQILYDVNSYDITSSYPTQQLTHKFPMKPFKWLVLKQKRPEARISRVFNFIGLGYAVVGTYQFKNIRLKNPKYPIPYISLSKCDAKGADRYDKDEGEHKKGDKINPNDLDMIIDNGRILQCSYMEISLTEIDLKIVLEQYTYDKFDVIEAMVASKDYLPLPYREVILDYYKQKTLLKGDDTEDGKYMYTKSKNSLNSVYGMSCTNPVHNDIVYDPGHIMKDIPDHDGDYYVKCYDDYSDDELEKLLKNAPFPYQWGVYCTALAREQLEQAIRLTIKPDGSSNLVYVDTDSIKVIGDINLQPLNEKLKQRAIKMGAYAEDSKGKVYYMGLFSFDGHADRFVTQGAKRYAYETDGKIKITVAGVSKKINEKTGIPFAVEELKKLERFRVGMTWRKAGGVTAVYNTKDDFIYTEPTTGNKLHITSNVSLVPSTYVMTYSDDYALLMKDIMLYGDYRREIE